MSRQSEQLVNEVTLREASLEDAQRELDSGELSQEQFERIEERESLAIATAKGKLRDLEEEPRSSATSRVRKKRWLVVGLGCIVVAVAVLLWSAVSPRQAGNSITGDLSLSNAQKVQQYLGEAQVDIADGDATTALDAYQNVLAIAPKNVAALTQVGWLEFSAGSSSEDLKVMRVGVNDLRKAIALAPKLAAPRLYYAIVADATPGNQALAKSQFEVFLALKPSAGQLAIAKPFLTKLGLTS
jgi:cytochrome c-type biogenesis protein CcmH/NrfG